MHIKNSVYITALCITMSLLSMEEDFASKTGKNEELEELILQEDTTPLSLAQNRLWLQESLENKNYTDLATFAQSSLTAAKQITRSGKQKESILSDALEISKNNVTGAESQCTWKGNTGRRNLFIVGVVGCGLGFGSFIYHIIKTQDDTIDRYTAYSAIATDIATMGFGAYAIKNAIQNVAAQAAYNNARIFDALLKIESSKAD